MSSYRIVILTGAGISAESGLGTFRDKDGVWTRVSLEDVATPEGFARNQPLVQEFYNKRRRDMLKASHNAAHTALSRLQSELAARNIGEMLLVTQNVDNLHEASGSTNVVHMHGELGSAMCVSCDWREPWLFDIEPDTPCPACGPQGCVRPDVVWFGEIPYRMDEIYERLTRCDLFISIGTSGAVYPAADFVREAKQSGAQTLELCLDPSENANIFDNGIYGPATEVVPYWVDKWLSER